MGRSVSRAIDNVIEKKINSGDVLNNGIRDLYKYSKLIAANKQEFHKYCFQFDDLVEKENLGARVDVYNNKFYNFYESKVKKTQCKFNLLRLFKPGELLTSVSNVN